MIPGLFDALLSLRETPSMPPFLTAFLVCSGPLASSFSSSHFLSCPLRTLQGWGRAVRGQGPGVASSLLTLEQSTSF